MEDEEKKEEKKMGDKECSMKLERRRRKRWMAPAGASMARPGGDTFAAGPMMLPGGAIICKTVSAPVNRVKLLLQNQDELIRQGRLDRPYKGIVDCAVRTVKSEGVFPLWRGNLVNCLHFFPATAMTFAFRGMMKRWLNVPKDASVVKRFAANVASGGCAGSLALLFVYPLDYARTRLPNDVVKGGGKDGERQFKGIVDVFRQTRRSDGLRGLYRGFVVSCVGIFVYRGMYFGFYHSLKPAVLDRDAGLLPTFCFAYGVTVAAGYVSYPIDTIRRRMMMTSGATVKYEGSIDCAAQILKNEGFASLMKGAGANILRGVVGGGTLVGMGALRKFYGPPRWEGPPRWKGPPRS